MPSKNFAIDFSIREDWGWHIGLKDPVCNMSVGSGYSGEGDYGLHCFVRPEQPRLWHFFKRAEVSDRIAALNQVENILRESGKMSELHWREDAH